MSAAVTAGNSRGWRFSFCFAKLFSFSYLRQVFPRRPAARHTSGVSWYGNICEHSVADRAGGVDGVGVVDYMFPPRGSLPEPEVLGGVVLRRLFDGPGRCLVVCH